MNNDMQTGGLLAEKSEQALVETTANPLNSVQSQSAEASEKPAESAQNVKSAQSGKTVSGASAEEEYGDSGVVLLQSAYEGCDMGVRSLKWIVKSCDDANLAEILARFTEKYNKLNHEIAGAIYSKGAEPKKAPFAVKAMAKANIAFKRFSKNCSESYARMAYKGAEAGILDLNHLLNEASCRYGEEEKGYACRMLALHRDLRDKVESFL